MISKDIINLRRDVGLALDSLEADKHIREAIWEAWYLGYRAGIEDFARAYGDDDPWDRSTWQT